MRAHIPCFVLVYLLSGAVQAQLRDPTEPPAALRTAEAIAAGAEVPASASSAPQLQSVLISEKRRVAVIDGVTLRIGQRHRGAVVSAIEPTRVVLLRGKTKEILRLYPAPAGGTARQR